MDDENTELTHAVALLQRGGHDERQSRYLSYRACYFSENEAIAAARITPATLRDWRFDPAFAEIEVQRIAQFQKQYHRHALSVEYVRNFRLVLEKDAELLRKSLNTKQVLTQFEQTYLNKMRGAYTPEQLDRLSRLAIGQGDAAWDFSKFIVTLSQERTIRMEGRPEMLKEAISEVEV